MPTPIDRHEVQRLAEQDSAQLVEVLPSAEFEEAHLPGAINIPLDELDGESTGVLNKDAPVIVY
ncbi:MAG: rhodanese-like domain-containing protein [Chloroflexi bacterium]|nr:rhodanese-like domain-containing protein [Chloroflexota bacterium]MCH8114162.1 rhodanese-like domain-containing protein [Chloroflexota bacterium]MCI0776322.1 rhodanese-like domain-containing protein [Chloroflexota bacterium]MCI0804571.1 rhodanese-like domain-containing protein [Chloroflexota bacterium]MCI0809673.1 rhodanese-like domain-containing protein [Chloroflexota bacterium]